MIFERVAFSTSMISIGRRSAVTSEGSFLQMFLFVRSKCIRWLRKLVSIRFIYNFITRKALKGTRRGRHARSELVSCSKGWRKVDSVDRRVADLNPAGAEDSCHTASAKFGAIIA